MAKPAHTRVTYSGVVGTAAAPVERWSFNLNFPDDALDDAASDAAADAAAVACATPFYSGGMGAQFFAETRLTECRVAAVGADGHVLRRADGSYVQGIHEGDHPGSVGGNGAMPLQTALCVSLNTTRPGASGKGRFFLPWGKWSIDQESKILPVDQTNEAIIAVQGFLNAVQTALGSQLQVVSSKGFMSEVTSIRIGRVPDTMRSRREDVPEGYLSRPLA